ncbi:MAG: SMC family ATPase [Candidatus Brocadiales bacterium]|nr:SMC family ATPase [Candidatus Bathyanammoxibius amoris]
MFLRTLKLRNYRKFRNEMIEFPEGVIGIIGPNGVGKSSILEAIGWALYGNVMARTEKHEVKSQNATANEDCRVELEFDMTGHCYKVIRELKGGNAFSNALIYANGNCEPEAQRDSGVNEYLKNLLGMDYVTFLRTIYAKQKDLAALSLLRPEERKKVIRRMLNIDRIDIAITQIRSDKRQKEDYIKGIEISLEDVEEFKARRKKILSEQVEIKKSISELNATVSLLLEERVKIKKEKSIQDQKYKTFNELGKQKALLHEKQSSLKKQLEECFNDKKELEQKNKELKNLKPKEQEYTKIKAENKKQEELRLKYQAKVELKENVSEKREDIKDREKKLSAIMEKLKAFENVDKEFNKIEKDMRSREQKRRIIEKRAKKNHGESEVLKSKIEELSLKKNDISKLGPGSKCPTCFRELGKTHPDIIRHIESEKKAYRKELEVINQQKYGIDKKHKNILGELDALVGKKNKIIQKLKKKSELDQSLKEQRDELKNVELNLSKNEEKLKKLKEIKFDKKIYEQLSKSFEKLSKIMENVIALRNEVQRIPKLLEKTKSLKIEITKSDNALKVNNQELKELGFDGETYNYVKTKYEEVSERLKGQQMKLQGKKHQMELSKQELVSVNKDIRRQEKYRKEIKKSEIDLQYLQRLESLIEDFRLELTGRIRPLLESKASYLFNEVTEGRYPAMELDENYEVSILDGNQAYRLKRFSGGEEDLANLCLRIAMSQVIAERSGGAEINFIALDEIFGSQDEKRKQSILNSINRLSSQFRQIFLITHIEDIKEMFYRVLRIEENPVTKESSIIIDQL